MYMDYESDGTPKDLWDNEQSWNSNSQTETLTINPINRTREKKKTKTLTDMAERYRKAWKTVYNRLPEWRRKEIDERIKNGTMGEDKTDFSRQVAALAEKQ